jgi:hypothetical protein
LSWECVRGSRGRPKFHCDEAEDDARAADVADIVGVYYDLDAEAAFDARAVAAAFADVVQTINNGTAFRVY